MSAERDLAAEHGVSYVTMRRAMAVLRECELIQTVHGRGMFIADPLPPDHTDTPA
ncbi:GntR family transcriptional regulator [Streptomyces sp. NPDC048650]|uniref:GntR family transcriptional regulator n=1 Tax=unclassified Streptomyces TaxID=2593676 RepID=UPI00371ADF9D